MKKKLEAPILVLGVIAAFSFGSHVGARDTIISDVTEDQTLTDTPVCGTIPANPEQTITHKKEWRLECKYQCPNNPQRDCNPASQMHLVQATGSVAP